MVLNFWRNRLGKRMVSLMILASAVLSFVTAAFQLYSGYDRDRDRALSSFSIVEESFLSGLESALWEYNTSQVDLLLNGVLAQSDVAYLNLRTADAEHWEMGTAEDPGLVYRNFDLSFLRTTGQMEGLGTLRVGLSLEFVHNRLWGQFWTLLATNFAKTIMASLVMLLIFELLAARHLRDILRQSRGNWLDQSQPMVLDRTPHKDVDELDEIVATLNAARETAREAHEELAWKLTETNQLNAHLEEAGREQSEFTFAISHDLKSPANTIRMLVDELRDTYRDDPEDAAELIDDIDQTSRRMIQLVEDILAYSRAIGEEMAIEEVDLSAEIGAILHDLSGDITRLEAEIDVGDLPLVRGNGLQLRMLMQNLISNGIKFRDPARPPRVEISCADDPDRDAVRISVRDNGIGIAEEHLDKIFGLFQRLHTRSAYQGSGIGLAVCQRIVGNHGGSLEVTSEEGAGSTFTVVLPKTVKGRQTARTIAAE